MAGLARLHAAGRRNLNEREDYAAALAEPEPTVHVRCFGPLSRPPGDEVAFMAADAAG